MKTTSTAGDQMSSKAKSVASMSHTKQIMRKLLTHFILLVVAIVILFPFFWMVSIALKTDKEAISYPPSLFPSSFNVEHYREILSDVIFLRFFLNSVIVSSVITLIATFGSAIAGFIFAKFVFFGKKVLFYMFLATIMIPFQTYMVSVYLLALRLNALDSYFGLIFPSIISSFGIFFMRQNMQSIPDSLLQAAKIDGASNLTVFIRIVVPLSISAMAVLAILLFQIAWSDFIWPLLITSSKKMIVLELGLARLQNQFYVNYGTMMAGSTLAVVPVVVLYLFLRRYILEGIALTGIKY
jgi:multiple sugar transport system permease protein